MPNLEINDNNYIEDSPEVGKKVVAVPVPETNIGIDVNNSFLHEIIEEGEAMAVDIGQLNSFTHLSQNREQLYLVLDTMAQDSTISAVLETYAEDCTQPNDQGRIMWAESTDSNVQKYITFLLDSLNVDKHIYRWTYSLCKYGDVYLKLFRRSDFEQDLFKDDASQKTKLNEKFTHLNSPEQELVEDINNKEKESLTEDVVIKAYSADDKLVNYIEMVPNPAEMFELTKFGKSYAYVKTNTLPQAQMSQNSTVMSSYYTYKMKRKDVEIHNAVSFVHAALTDDTPRMPEKIEIFMDNNISDDADKYAYTVNRGQSILYNSYKIWRENMLLENALLLNRVTKSSILRIVEVEVADMSKDDVRKKLQRVKQLVEQKASINEGNSMEEYVNPGAMENNIYVPTHNGVGAIQTQQIGGDVNVRDIADIEHFSDRLFSSLKVPKQFFGLCLRGDTPILLLNGQTRTIKYLFDHRDEFIGKGIMACNEDGSLQPTTITNIALTRPSTSFLRVHLDNGEYVDVTDNHKMMLRDGSFVRADELEIGDALMPYYDRIKEGRRYVLDNATGKYRPQYRIVAESVYDIPKGYQVHHKNRKKIDDDFDNLVPLSLREHYDEHIDELHEANKNSHTKKRELGIPFALEGARVINNGIEQTWLKVGEEMPEGFDYGTLPFTQEHKDNISRGNKGKAKTFDCAKNFRQPGYTDRMVATKAERKEQGLYDETYRAHGERVREHARNHTGAFSEESIEKALASKGITENRRFRERTVRCACCGKIDVIKQTQDWYDDYLDMYKFWFCSPECKKISGAGKLGRSYKLLKSCDFDYELYDYIRWNGECRPDTYFKSETLKDLIESYLDEYVPECNHRVVGIEYLDVDEPAYDISVAHDCHTFALPCGIFVHNCDDAAGFNGGTSLSIISSRYARTVVRIQNALVQALTDCINILLIDRGLDNYVNKFSLHMQAPTTQEELDRKDAQSMEIRLIDDTMNMLGDIEDPIVKLKILKSLLVNVITNVEAIGYLQDYIDSLEFQEEELEEDEKSFDFDSELDSDLDDLDFGGHSASRAPDLGDMDIPEVNEPEEEENLPSPADLDIDLTDL